MFYLIHFSANMVFYFCATKIAATYLLPVARNGTLCYVDKAKRERNIEIVTS